MARSWGGILALMLVLMGVFQPLVVKGDLNPSECKEERRLLVNACRPVIFGRSPSPDCCQRVRVMHVECVCPVVTPKLAALIGVERTIKQIEACGRTVPHHFKCGSITTP
ncbi:hypothetical protein SLE2022_021830 [Rubroshorea leprosula]|uniref:Bifunctional inhibitor/plant lipid transfer protein/seed storage helical domain-containing protein n=1 Tax=Rubroshorea leprosula TaxID=152421 RepID=A0AAV5M7U6_9ROSI|nr:hypothetical protein SLEP1_g52584 [Rubroshorea leprosula]